MSSFGKGYVSDLPWVPARKRDVRKALELLDIQDGEKVADLGSGNGQVLFIGARKYNAEFTGVELSNFWCKVSRFKYKVYRLINKLGLRKLEGSVKIINSDFLDVDLSQFNKIYLYCTTEFIEQLIPKFKEELPKDALISSVMFPVEDEGIEKIKTVDMNNKYKVYLYKLRD